jgi:hypothetical protein
MTPRANTRSDKISGLLLLNRRLRRTKRRLLLQYLENNPGPNSSVSLEKLDTTVAEQNRSLSPYSS